MLCKSFRSFHPTTSLDFSQPHQDDGSYLQFWRERPQKFKS